MPRHHIQTKSLEEFKKCIIEAMELYIENDKNRSEKSTEYIGIQKVEITF